MPYHVHSADDPPEAGRTYATAQQAGQSKQAGEILTFLASTDEINMWRDREYTRRHNGEYATVPFFDLISDRYPDHYIHLSLTKPGMLAYTKSVQHGIEDRQTIIRPGKYLTEYYADLGPEVIARYAGMVTASAIDLHFARTPDEILTAYTADLGSCMRAGKSHLRALPQHPVRAYGDSDLAVAYTGPIEDVTARCIVWPDRLIYNRPYGHTSLIEALLKTAGYKQGRIEGARIRAIKFRGGYIVPYVDGVGSGSLTDDGDRILLDDSGPIDLHNTSGVASGHTCSDCGSACDDDNDLCESCQENTFTCDDCDRRVNDDQYHNVNDSSICDRCYDRNYTCCHACSETIANDNAQSYDGTDYCNDCFSDRFTCCEHCSEDTPNDEIHYSEVSGESYCDECWSCKDHTCLMEGCDVEWNEYDVFTYDQRKARKQSKTNDLCTDCADRFCHVCECTHDAGECTVLADAESDGFGVCWSEPDGTPWQIGLPLSFATVPPEPEPEPERSRPDPSDYYHWSNRVVPYHLQELVTADGRPQVRSWRTILSPSPDME